MTPSSEGDDVIGGWRVEGASRREGVAVLSPPPRSLRSRTPSKEGVWVICFTPSSEGVNVIGGWCLGWLFERLESQQFVAVVLVLFSAQGDLSGQAALQVLDQGLKAVKNCDDLILNVK